MVSPRVFWWLYIVCWALAMLTIMAQWMSFGATVLVVGGVAVLGFLVKIADKLG